MDVVKVGCELITARSNSSSGGVVASIGLQT